MIGFALVVYTCSNSNQSSSDDYYYYYCCGQHQQLLSLRTTTGPRYVTLDEADEPSLGYVR